MHKKNFLFPAMLLLFSSLTIAQGINIEGTYELVIRELPDGTRIKAPEIMGLLTITETHRNFNVVSQDKDGKHFSYSLVSTYKLTKTEYTETVLFSIMNDEIGGNGITYTTSEQTATVPVKISAGKLEIEMPFDPVTIIFDGDRLKATSEGMFTDYWKKIED